METVLSVVDSAHKYSTLMPLCDIAFSADCLLHNTIDFVKVPEFAGNAALNGLLGNL